METVEMQRSSLTLVSLLVLAAAPACKGKVEVRPDPQTLKERDDCNKALEDRKTYIASLEKQLADQQLAGAGNVLVTIQGEAMQISGRGPHEQAGDAKGNANDARLYEAFVEALKKSRGSIQKCYQAALKNNTALQARTVTLNIQVDYKTSGDVSKSGFEPRISEGFDQCMEAVARRWNLPAMPRGVTFAYRQTLTPE
jgi:hypothetical protein